MAADQDKKVFDDLLKAISRIGVRGATTRSLCSKVKLERHTIAKYLAMMEHSGLVYHQQVGKAKVWHLAQAPLRTILNVHPNQRTLAEGFFADMITYLPCGMMIIDVQYKIMFMNAALKDRYGDLEGKTLYQSVLGKQDALQLKKIAVILDHKKGKADFSLRDKDRRMLRVKASYLDSPDNIPAVILIMEDVTTSKRSLQQQLLSYRRIEAERNMLSQHLLEVELDDACCITAVNECFLQATSHTRVNVVGKPLDTFSSGHHTKSFCNKILGSVTSSRAWNGSFSFKSISGKRVRTKSTLVFSPNSSKKKQRYLLFGLMV